MYEIYENKTRLNQDFEFLSLLVQNKVNIEDLDIETKKRLLVICTKRNEEIKKKIMETKKKISNLKKAYKKTKVDIN